MRRISLPKQIVIGLLLGAILLLSFPTGAQAQWATFDKPNWLLKLEEMEREVRRWEERVKQYDKMFEKATQTVGRLTNILQTVDEQLARNKRLIVAVAGIGNAVRRVFELKRQYQNMIQCRIISVQRLWSRLRNGIFNPEQNMRDLEAYLKNSIGRSSEDEVARLERLAMMDMEFERLRFELAQAYERLAEAEQLLKAHETLLRLEMEKPEADRQGVDTLQHLILADQQWIEQLNKQISDLTKQITDRAKLYGMEINQRTDFGRQIANTNDAFGAIIEGKQEILEEIQREFESDEEPITEDGDWQ